LQSLGLLKKPSVLTLKNWSGSGVVGGTGVVRTTSSMLPLSFFQEQQSIEIV